MKTKILFLTYISLFSFTASLMAKERVVTGKISAFKIFAVKNASILVKSTKVEIATDSTGCFSFTCDESEKLTFSANGFFSEKINLKDYAVNDSVNVELRLKKGKKNFEYATGYGHISEKNLTYAIEHLEAGPDYSSYNTILDIMEGRISGITITNASVNIRGNKTINGGDVDALLIVDGTIVDFSVFRNLPPTDIKSIDVLKGAAASSRYGSRGMGGVVIIKTKTSN